MSALRVLVAGAGGALGRHVTRELARRGHEVRALVRTRRPDPGVARHVEVVAADALVPDQLDGPCRGRDVVFSCVGASVLPDLRHGRASFHRVDVPANLNLLGAAERAGARRFVYVSVAGQEILGHHRYVSAHEAVVDALGRSRLSRCVIRPPGFFSAFSEILRIARRGAAPVIGDGSARTNPIDDRDLAEVCSDAVEGDAEEVIAGGPDVLTRRRIVDLAFHALGKPARLRTLPAGLVGASARLIRPINPRVADLTAFYVDVSTRDLVVPSVGRRRLADYFHDVVSESGDG